MMADPGDGEWLNQLARSSGAWLRGTGPDADIVISSRTRLARNIAGFAFVNRADDDTRTQIRERLEKALQPAKEALSLRRLKIESLSQLDRRLLVERQLISRELSEGHGPRDVWISKDERLSVMVNEEDHVRMQVLHSGFALGDCWEEIDTLDNQLEEALTWAFHEQLGYLTACPTNIGTGIRVSVMVHLPALRITGEIQKVYQASQKIGLTVRGLYGEGSQAMGDFYQISNQVTLGSSESELIGKLNEVVPGIVKYERRVRNLLLRDNESTLHDRIARAHGILQSARSISSEETMQLLSDLRMGIYLKLVKDVTVATVNELFINTQPAHLQRRRGEELESTDRNLARASFLRARMSGEDELLDEAG